jgi:hypothetical protein
MENNFNMGIFQKNIVEKIVIEDSYAEKYYNENKNSLFINNPFTKVNPGITARIIIMDDEKKNSKDYEKMLLENKNCIPIENFNPKTMKMTDSKFSDSLISMKNKEIRELVLDNSQKVMVYKISEEEGQWYSYKEVSDKVKLALRKKMIEEESGKIINKIKKKLDIKVCKNTLENYIEEKNIIQKNQIALFNSLEKTASDSDLELDEIEEVVEEQEIKQVKQETVKK